MSLLRRSTAAFAVLAGLLGATVALAATERKPIALDDLFQMRDVSDPRLSPDGAWVAYAVRTLDAKRDKADSNLYMTRWDGTQTVQLTFTPGRETMPRFSPDGTYLAFLASRDDDDVDQIWLLRRSGGEAEKLTDFKGGVEDYVWSPDGSRLAVIADDPDPEAEDKTKEGCGEEKTPKPIVIDRYYFKEDISGYLGKQRSHLYLFDLKTRAATQLTTGQHDERYPDWSPDGGTIVFVTKRGADPDRTDNWDLYLIDAKAGAKERQLTTFDGSDGGDESWGRPRFSPDGRSIAYIQGGPQKLIYYAVQQLAVIPVAGGSPRLLTTSLDRPIVFPRWSADGRSLYFLFEDDRRSVLGRVPAGGGRIERLIDADEAVMDYDLGPGDRLAFLSSTTTEPYEVYALDRGRTRPLSRQNEALLARLSLGATEGITFRSKDGTDVRGFVVKPPDYRSGRRYPTILRIHGGPVGQYAWEFDFDWQLFAAHGYVVVAANPRGSSGRGGDFTKAIYADWGYKDVQDVLAAVDHVVAAGIADPDRLGVGGWSYGGMMTNYTIATDTRFKAATSGAGISNALAGWGTDMYIREYVQELGTPWENLDAYMHVSFPFLHANTIVTPTLFLCGEKDFNVPLLNSEQMYEALRYLGIDTELIIYPGQFHGIRVPSYQKDRLQRYLDWYGRYLKK
ncbi:MAG TPA: S9 family peptidase [Candidatus Polarisedimenticolia bacterium]|nr:S9 family peptidase [Candidatus Polarisedimenticolia bacterium]